MALSDYQYKYRGLTIGASTSIDVVQETGIRDLVVRTAGDRELPRGHGFFSSIHRADRKYITFDLEAFAAMGSSTLADLVESIMEAFSVDQNTEPDETNDKLNYKYPGEDEKFVYARPTRRTIVRTIERTMGRIPIAVQLVCNDPRRYKATQTDSGTESGTFSVSNGGDAYAYPHLYFVADGSGDVQLDNNTNGDQVVMSGLGASGTVNLRMDRLSRGSAELIAYDGATDKYTKWDLPRSVFKLDPGSNSLTLTTGTSVRVYHYDTWM